MLFIVAGKLVLLFCLWYEKYSSVSMKNAGKNHNTIVDAFESLCVIKINENKLVTLNIQFITNLSYSYIFRYC